MSGSRGVQIHAYLVGLSLLVLTYSHFRGNNSLGLVWLDTPRA